MKRSIQLPKLLLHCCCAPCTTTVFERLSPDYNITLLFYNPNIEPEEEYYKRAKEGKYTAPPPNVEGYFERCAGGRLYELQKALGIKLKIKSVDVSPLKENVSNPVVFTFEIAE